MATIQDDTIGIGRFNARDARRIARAVEQAERPGHSPRRRLPAGTGPDVFVMTCECVETITAKSGDLMGVGKVRLFATDPDAGTETLSDDPDDELTVYNSFHSPCEAAAGKTVQVCWTGGVWKLMAEECVPEPEPEPEGSPTFFAPTYFTPSFWPKGYYGAMA